MAQLALDHPQRAQRDAQLKGGAPLLSGQELVTERRAGRVDELERGGAIVQGARRTRKVGVRVRLVRARRVAPAIVLAHAIVLAPAVAVEQLEQVPLHLAGTAADDGVLDRAHRSRQMAESLHYADHPPAQRPRELPPGQRLAVHLDAGVARVGVDQLLARAKSRGGAGPPAPTPRRERAPPPGPARG